MINGLMDQPVLLLLFGVVIPFVLFVAALVDILRRQGLDGTTRLLWVVLVLLLPLLGAVLWFVLRARYGTRSASAG